MIISLLLCAIQLTGVVGNNLRARAFFDANNVKVGDPLTLTIDFLGEADFKALHPPALSKVVDRKQWKLDDMSAKTDTFRDARRLTYRIRPMKDGLLWFPALEFSYVDVAGVQRKVTANSIPVHAKAGRQVVMDEMSEGEKKMPQPPELITKLTRQSSDDMMFAWKKVCHKPTADGFAEFDFPEARLNEASCAIREGNWARAMKIYNKLEWIIGQTPELEQGMIAALALQYDSPDVELAVWRQLLRPVLRFDWKGRASIVLGVVLLVWFILWIIGLGIKAVACLVIALGVIGQANAQGIFEQMEEQMNLMHQQFERAFGGFGFRGGIAQEPITIDVSVKTSKPVLQVGDPFEFVFTLKYPKTASVGQIQMTPTERFGLVFTGQAENLPDGEDGPSNVVKRISVPARYDVPYQGKIGFVIEGMVSSYRRRGAGMMRLSLSNSFRSETKALEINVQPLKVENQPADFGGIISEGLRIHETCDILKVETNDVVVITYKMFPKGYVPDGFLPKDAAFEWMRHTGRDGLVTEIEYCRYFVADGAEMTPKVSIPYYNPLTKTYERAETGGTRLKYDIIEEK